jgi:superfamily I DNA and RNA helicase
MGTRPEIELKSSRGGGTSMAQDLSVIYVLKVSELMSQKGFQVFPQLSEDWPEIVAIGAEPGIVIINIFSDSPEDELALENAKINLSRQSVSLLEAIPELKKVPRIRKLLVVNSATEKAISRSLDALIASLPIQNISISTLSDVCRLLEPAFSFSSKPDISSNDVGNKNREEQRFVLDKEQASAAENIKADIRVVEGPAGSGKTLVLVAKAKKEARLHPNWKIQILCYSSVLARYLATFFEEFENVSIDTFHTWQRREGMTFAGSDCKAAEYTLKHLRNITPSIDVLLIDEIQDFCPSWITAALMATYRGRGGVLVVGDPNQSLYGEKGLLKAISGLNLSAETIYLQKPYRSTRQILGVVNALSGDFDVENKEEAPEGKPVDLIFCNAGVDEQAKLIAERVRELFTLGIEPRDICITSPNNYEVKGLAGALSRVGLDVLPFWKNDHDITALDFNQNKIKLLTSWKAKGLEFDTVFMVGFDRLKNPDELGITAAEKTIRDGFAKLCLVAPTRAKNRLTVIYSRANVFLERLSQHKSLIRELRWPADFEESV